METSSQLGPQCGSPQQGDSSPAHPELVEGDVEGLSTPLEASGVDHQHLKTCTQEPKTVLSSIIPVLVLAGATLLLYGRPLFTDAALYFRDILHQYWPGREAIAQAIREWRIPEWDPSQQAGLPLAANPHVGLFYPLNVLYFLLPFPKAYAWLVALHHFSGGLGFWVLMRRWLSPSAALAGALTFSFSGFTVGLSSFEPLLAGLSYSPWVLWGMTAPWRRLHRVAFVGVLWTMQALAGDPMALLFSALIVMCWMLTGAEKKELLIVAVLAGVLALGLAAVQLMPAAQLFQQSTRAVSVGDELANSWALHPVRIAEWFFPLLLGRFLEPPYYWAGFLSTGPNALPFNVSLYLGAAGIVFALLGCSRNRLTAFALVLGAVGLLFALGSHGPAGMFLNEVPPFRFFRYPEKYAFLIVFAGSTLVALGVAGVTHLGTRRTRPSTWALLVVIAILAVAFALAAVMHFEAALLEPLWKRWGPLMGNAKRVPSAASFFAAVAPSLWSGAVMGSLALAVVGVSRRLRPDLLRTLVGLLISVDLLSAAFPLVWTVSQDLYETRPPLVDELKALAPTLPFRFWRDNVGFEGRSIRGSGYDLLAAKRGFELGTLKSSLGTVFELEELSGYSAVGLRRWQTISAGLYFDPAQLFGLFATCIGVGPVVEGHLEGKRGLGLVATQSELVRLYVAERCLPRLHAVRQTVEVESVKQALKVFRTQSIDLSTVALVEGVPGSVYGPAEIEQIATQSSQLSASVTARESTAFVVFATSYYPGWTVHVDDTEVPLRIVNGATMGAEVPPGQHLVEFRFRDRWLRAGAWVTFFGLSILLALLWRSHHSHRYLKSRDSKMTQESAASALT